MPKEEEFLNVLKTMSPEQLVDKLLEVASPISLAFVDEYNKFDIIYNYIVGRLDETDNMPKIKLSCGATVQIDVERNLVEVFDNTVEIKPMFELEVKEVNNKLHLFSDWDG